ncbi:MAG: phospholipase D-like domain-containing protein [Bacteroidetes bacterium]|nr:phospholipase D-like domain-containing protein [Bacteroidota bacterium]
MDILKSKNGTSVRAYKGDAMTLLAFDLDESKTKDFAGFSIRVTPPGKTPYYLFNRMTFKPDVLTQSGIDPDNKEINSMEFAPVQKFRWVHVPATDHNINDWIFGNYTYEITPRSLVNNILKPIDGTLTVSVTIEVSPYQSGDLQIGFTRGFIESQAYTRHFGSSNKIRPNKTDLVFDITKTSGPTAADKKKHPYLKDYSYEYQHTWLGWQARKRILDFLSETILNTNLSLDVFAFDLDEPIICDSVLQLARQGRVRVILDNSKDHTKPGKLEPEFDKQYRQTARDPDSLIRGCFKALAHSKVFIQKLNGKPAKVLTGSTNFATNGLYINANHVIIFDNKKVAGLYEEVFENSLSQAKMDDFQFTVTAINDFVFDETGLPSMTIHFSPHSKEVAQNMFDTIKGNILGATSDVLFAIMKDKSASSILEAIKKQVKEDKIFTYGITDVIGDKTEIMLYKPDSRKGVRIAGRPGEYFLPPPWEAECKIPGISVHHKFVVVDFKGQNPVVYCGSSNLAFGPEQRNGDNLIEIRDKDAVTVFAIEAIRLVDHFHFRNKLSLDQKNTDTNPSETQPISYLHDSSEKNWVNKYYNTNDLMFLERTLLIS